MNTKKCLLLVGLSILLVGVGGAGWVANRLWHPSPESPTTPAESHPPESEEGVVCTGYVELEHGIRSLAPGRPGRVATLVVKENDHVEAGAPILRLEDDDAQFQVSEAEAAVEAAEVQLAQARKLGDRQRARLAQQRAAIQAAGFRLDAARELLARKEKQLMDKLVSAQEVAATRDEVKALEAQQTAEN